jgi:UDP-N-acetylmuramoylalanine--D-glutamate ligase
LELAGKQVVVVGLARSGIAAAGFLARRGARVVATDRRAAAELQAEAMTLAERGVRLELGGHRAETLTAAELVVVSPGVPWDLPELVAARSAGVAVMAELELGARHIRGPIAAVTGTKGKSTTTAALGAMLREAGRDVRVAGNIGQAVTGLLDGATDETLFVLEVSSFQLEGTDTFHPKVAVFLNLSADHLDRHPSFEAYAAAKARIFANQTSEDWAVINRDDLGVLERANQTRARLVPFTTAPASHGASSSAFFRAGHAVLRLDGLEESLFPVSSVRLPGSHLLLDLLAAAAAARLMGAPADAIARAVAEFQGIEHVLERVAEIEGVVFFNDSKATNVDAARKSLEAFDRPVVAILGGRYKGGDFADLRADLARRGRAVMAIGETRPRVAADLASVLPVVLCDSLEEAVFRAFAAAQRGDVVLLAPACSSFDMFQDYADRGRAFKGAVRALASRVAASPGRVPEREA